MSAPDSTLEILAILSRGNDVREWPEDEQHAYRAGKAHSNDFSREVVTAIRAIKVIAVVKGLTGLVDMNGSVRALLLSTTPEQTARSQGTTASALEAREQLILAMFP